MNPPSRHRVLVADDEEAIRALVARILRRAGLEAVEAADGEEAIEKIGEAPFDALVLDLMMPRVDGFGVVEHLIENKPDMIEKTVVLTAYPRTAARERLHHLCSIMSKPFDVQELLSRIRECIAR